MKKQYPTPEYFEPSEEDQINAALSIAKHLSRDRVLVTKGGKRIRGQKSNTKKNEKAI